MLRMKSRRAAALTLAAMTVLTSSSALAWGPWGGWGPMENFAGPFSGWGGPFSGSMGPWSMGSMHIQRPRGGPMTFSTGSYGAYDGPYAAYYGGAYVGPGGYPAPAYPAPEPAYPPEGAYYGYPNDASATPQMATGTLPPPAASSSMDVPPPPGPFVP